MVSQGVGGHEGYSGTPLWKIQQQNAAMREQMLQESLLYAAERMTRPAIPPNVLSEAVSFGGPCGKPFTRHVLIKCLRKVAQNAKIELPSTGIFQNQAPMGLFALFDGQSSAGLPGSASAEYCARNFHKKVMENIASLPETCTSETFVKAALIKSFEDLDKDVLEQPDIVDGCGAAIGLIVGDNLFTAVLGACEGILCEVSESGTGQAVPLGKNQGRCHLPDERARLLKAGSAIFGEGLSAHVKGPAGASYVSRTLGDPRWKQPGFGTVLLCVPEIQATKLSWAERHPFLLLSSRPVTEALNSQRQVDLAMGFPAQPRAACGEIATQAAELQPPSVQCTVVQVWFLVGGPATDGVSMVAEEEPGGPGGPPKGVDASATVEAAPRKKPRMAERVPTAGEVKSARLRHILVRFHEGERLGPDVVSQKVIGTRPEAETLLRGLLRELSIELDDLKRRFRGKKPEELALRSEKFAKLCKEHSVCPTAQKGGGMCGDLGWLTREAQRRFGKEFLDVVAVLRPGDWSDIVASTDGLHIVQRIA